jgi:SpoVK/Ycf46/Vps4 family AAA+-type ATPase
VDRQQRENLHGLFEQAPPQAALRAVLRRVDALAASRADMRTSAGRHMINQFSRGDGRRPIDNDGLLILAATNAPWHVDRPSAARPVRRILHPPPDAPPAPHPARDAAGQARRAIDHEHVAKKTDGFSGADLKAVVGVTIESKLRQSMGDGVPRPMTTKDSCAAVSQVRPSTKEWFAHRPQLRPVCQPRGVYDEILST